MKAELVAAAKAAWPAVDVDAADFVRYVEERIDPAASLETLCLSDLYLACGCARGDARALGAFDDQLARIAKHVRKLCAGPDDVEEVMQVVRTRMLVRRDADPPKILGYGGRGPLAGWLRVAAVRVARDLHRARGALREDGDVETSEPVQPIDPELAVMKARYGSIFRTALNEVLAALPDRERNILAMSVIDGLSTDAIGALYRVNGSTVRRWLGMARERVLADVRARLQVTLDVQATEFDSLMGLVRSQLDVNLSQLLRRPPR